MPTRREADGLLPFQRIQLQFAAHLRDPELPPPAGVDPGRMAVYRDLVFNNLDDLLSRAFPVLRRISTDSDWRHRLRRFLIEHRAHTPLFAEVGAEFVHWIVDGGGATADDPPFVAELVHFERQQVEVAIAAQQCVAVDVDRHGDLLAGMPVLSPGTTPLSYRFPVHRIDVDCRPEAATDSPTCLVLHGAADSDVQLVEINAVTYRLLDLLLTSAVANGRQALHQVADELGTDVAALLAHGSSLLEDLRSRGIIAGTRLETR